MPPISSLFRPVFLGAVILFTSLLSANGAESTKNQPADIDLRLAILAPISGHTSLDNKIAKLQAKVKTTSRAEPIIVQLGWAFVAKARVSSDPGFYKLAELCAHAADDEVAADPDAMLLRGHIAHALHRFSEAEAIGRKLASETRPRWESFALLGDGLMEQGKLGEAIEAYQRMIDIRPCLQTYARVAHIRWLKGDLEGAAELMATAVEESSERDPEPAAWAYTRLATYQLQAGNTADAARSLNRATDFLPDYPGALLIRAKLLVSNNKCADAVPILERAIQQSPLPEYQWMLADTAQIAGEKELAAKTEGAIRMRGKSEDPRSFSLFLASRHENSQLALALAQEELNRRHDVFTYDAVAWAALANGDAVQAQKNIEHALSEGTVDARLFYHAGQIAQANGEKKIAVEWFAKAVPLKQMLLPSEQADLRAQLSHLPQSAAIFPASTTDKLATTGRN
jgi:tetratricopeptide (TPR) repeat protein